MARLKAKTHIEPAMAPALSIEIIYEIVEAKYGRMHLIGRHNRALQSYLPDIMSARLSR